MSGNNDKVYICYREQVANYLSLSVYQYLRHDYDVFLDTANLNHGNIRQIKRNQIADRTNFLLILTTGSLEQCTNQDDIMRTEIQWALELGRNVVPILADNFTLENMDGYLLGKLAEIKQLNYVTLHQDMFDESMEKIRKRFLKGSKSKVHFSLEEQKTVMQIKEENNQAPAPTQSQLKAEDHFAQGRRDYENKRFENAIAEYSKAIDVNPQYAFAYSNRGAAYKANNMLVQAIEDYSKAIEINPNLVEAYINRGIAFHDKKHYENAIEDFSKALEINPNLAEAHNSRGLSHYAKKELDEAIQDYTKALEIKSAYVIAHNNRAVAYRKKHEYDSALADYDMALYYDSGYATAYNNRAELHFIVKRYKNALMNFELAIKERSNYAIAIAGLAITHHALGNFGEAKSVWRRLLEKEINYRNADWVGQQFNWHESLIEEARELIAKL